MRLTDLKIQKLNNIIHLSCTCQIFKYHNIILFIFIYLSYLSKSCSSASMLLIFEPHNCVCHQ